MDDNFKTEFQVFCSILHENLLHNGKHHQIMTIDTERNLLNYLLTQDNSECSEELSSWIQKAVFCVVSDESQTNYELHVWDDECHQKKVVSLENYYLTLSNLYLQNIHISLESFQKKVKENYVLIPDAVVKYFFDHCSDNQSSNRNEIIYAINGEDKENKVFGHRVICYDYIKKKVMKRKVVTEKSDKSSGNVISTTTNEKLINEDFVYCLQKSEKLSDISNGQRNELSYSNYTASEPLEVKFLNKSVLAYFPPDEMQNHDHLVTLSELIYCDLGISPEKSQTVQMEFVIPKESPVKSAVDMYDFNPEKNMKKEETDHSSYIPKTKKKSKKPASNRKKVKVQKENATPTKSAASTGKLTIITDPITKGATLKIDPNSENDTTIHFRLQSSSSLFAAAAAMAESSVPVEPSVSCVPKSSAVNSSGDDHEDEPEDHVEDSDEQLDDQPTETGVEDKGVVTIQVLSQEESRVVAEKFEVEFGDSESIVDSSSLQDIKKEAAEDEKVESIKPATKRTSPKSFSKKTVRQPITSPSVNHAKRNITSREGQATDVQTVETTANDSIVDCLSTEIDSSFSEVDNPEDRTKLKAVKETNKIQVRRSLRRAGTKTGKVSIKEPSAVKIDPLENGCEPNPSDCDSETPIDALNEFECRFCTRKFKSKSGLYYHEKGHQFSERYPCETCGSIFPNKYCLRQHIRRVHLDLIKREYTCEFCGKKFRSWSGCDYHKTKEHIDKSTTCERCGKTFINRYLYRSHVYETHSGKKKRKRKPAGPQKCPDCGKEFKSHSGLAYHRYTQHTEGKLICSVCGVSLGSNRTLKIHMDIHDGKRLPVNCTICGKQYASKSSLHGHMETHEKSVSVNCKHCDKTFPSESYVRRHIKRVHTSLTENPKLFQCDLCQKNFKCLKNFKYHVLSHTGEKPYECTECGKRFRSTGTLSLHKKTHTGTKDHVCDFCGDSFVQRSNMIRHVKKHHF